MRWLVCAPTPVGTHLFKSCLPGWGKFVLISPKLTLRISTPVVAGMCLSMWCLSSVYFEKNSLVPGEGPSREGISEDMQRRRHLFTTQKKVEPLLLLLFAEGKTTLRSSKWFSWLSWFWRLLRVCACHSVNRKVGISSQLGSFCLIIWNTHERCEHFPHQYYLRHKP